MNAIQLLSKRIVEASRSRSPRRRPARDTGRSSGGMPAGRLARAG